MQEKVFSLSNINKTCEFAEKLAKFVKAGDVIAFSGDLGVGKTTFIQAFIKSLATEDIEVTSPTFNLLHIYNLSQFEIWHYDLYRINNIEEVYELGIEDSFHYAVTLIEWPEIINNIIPEDRLEIELFFGDSEFSREIKLKAYGIWKNKLTTGFDN